MSIGPSIEKDFKGYSIEVFSGHYTENNELTAKGEEFLNSLMVNVDNYKKIATEELIELYYDSWWNEDIGDLSPEQFMNHLQNPLFSIDSQEGEASIFFDDGGLFAGHYVECIIDNLEFKKCQIVG